MNATQTTREYRITGEPKADMATIECMYRECDSFGLYCKVLDLVQYQYESDGEVHTSRNTDYCDEWFRNMAGQVIRIETKSMDGLNSYRLLTDTVVVK